MLNRRETRAILATFWKGYETAVVEILPLGIPQPASFLYSAAVQSPKSVREMKLAAECSLP